MSPYVFAWILWILMFLAIELPAVFNRQPGDTLSEVVWKVFAVRGKPVGWQLRRLALLLGLGWLVAHLLSGGLV
ncbi:hypothetical protein DZF91_31820 [Actinomadura logoneensis]|uniref:Uncharacterized protein n=1 Tax=Actinomadura logoneensis TaxID=2293572 RepID=A0A372JCF8_9ACTN|nr:hypothetical protein [Actinomadura logoneensis]RFU37640.1 hypothetical protein DZF91_31820 [Actinomadura logoneensis]